MTEAGRRAGPFEDVLAERMLAGASPTVLRAGEWLFQEGEPADSAFVVQSGRLEVVVDDQVLRTAKRGAIVGELALLAGQQRSASVRALRDSKLLEIGRMAFEQAIADDHGFALSLCGALASQLSVSRGARAPEPLRTVAILALDSDMSVDNVAERLARELQPAGRATVLLPDAGRAIDDHAQLVDNAAAAGRWVILGADAGPADPWTATCLAEADRIVALSRGCPRADWLASAEALHDCELLIAGGVADWERLAALLAPRTVQVLADDHAIRRCLVVGARRLSGRALGLVLSGGGARAFAHLGVVEELHAAGVTVDRIAGTSMGAVIAAAVASDLDDAAIYEAVRSYFVEQNPSRDYALPLYSLLRGRRAQRLLAEGFGMIRIEELPLRFFCVSADLNSRSLVVHRTGVLHEAVFASLAIPGVFPPVPTPEGRLLVDGGVLDNLPIETMARDAEGPVIAVDVTRTGPWRANARTAPGSWRKHVSTWLTGYEQEVPRLAETMLRTLAVGSRDTGKAALRHADLVITPKVEDAGILDWKSLPRIREQGRAAVRSLLERSPATLDRFLP